MTNPETFALNTLMLLQGDPRRYRNFGPYWWFVKGLLKRYYTRDNLSLLGDYVAADASERMPEVGDVQAALAGAIEEYRQNAMFNMGRLQVVDGAGELYSLVDTDAGPAGS